MLRYGFTLEWAPEEILKCPITVIGDLIETKRTGRTLDAADIEALEEIKRFRGPHSSQ